MNFEIYRYPSGWIQITAKPNTPLEMFEVAYFHRFGSFPPEGAVEYSETGPTFRVWRILVFPCAV